MRFKKLVTLIILSYFLFFLGKPCFSEEKAKLVITATSFSKISIYVPDFSGNQTLGKTLSKYLRRALNYHLFVLATPFKPISPTPNSYEVSGEVKTTKKFVILKAFLYELATGKKLKAFLLKGPKRYPYFISYYLCDEVIKEISGYPGVAFTKVAFVKRTPFGDKLYIADFVKAHPRCLDQARLILFPKFSKQGDKLAYLVFSPYGYRLRVFNLKTLKKQDYFVKGICSTPVWDKSGNNLFLTVSKGGHIGIYELSLKTGNLKPILVGKGVYQASSVSPDGRYLAFVYDLGGDRPKVYIYDFKTHKKVRISGNKGYNTTPRFSPRGDTLAYLSRRAGVTFLKVVNLKNQSSKIFELPLNAKYFCFSPTGNYILAYGSGEEGKGVYLIHLDSGLYFVYLRGRNFLYPTWSRL